MKTSLLPFPTDPHKLSLWLFPPAPPVCTPEERKKLTSVALGNELERYTEYRLTLTFPDNHVMPKVRMYSYCGECYELDMIMYEPAAVPYRPEFVLVECKNYSAVVPHEFLVELTSKVNKFGARRGIMFINGRFTRRSNKIAYSSGLNIMLYNRHTRTFIPQPIIAQPVPAPPLKYRQSPQGPVSADSGKPILIIAPPFFFCA